MEEYRGYKLNYYPKCDKYPTHDNRYQTFKARPYDDADYYWTIVMINLHNNKGGNQMLKRWKLLLKRNKGCKSCCLWCKYVNGCVDELLYNTSV